MVVVTILVLCEPQGNHVRGQEEDGDETMTFT